MRTFACWRVSGVVAVLVVLASAGPSAAQAVKLGAVAPQTSLPPELAEWGGRVVDAVLARADPARFSVVDRAATQALLPQLRVDENKAVVRVPYYSVDQQKACAAALRAGGVQRVLSGEFYPLVYDYLLLLRVEDLAGGPEQMYYTLVSESLPHQVGDLADRLAERFADRLGLKAGSTPRANSPRLALPGQFNIVPGSATDPVSGLPSEVINQRDGSRMILVPAGAFVMGSREEQLGATDVRDCTPAHRVWLPAYYIGRCEVTNQQYETFVKAKPHRGRSNPALPTEWERAGPRVNQPSQPASFVSFDDAVAYAEWAGLVLPTEALWEKAARGPEGRQFPWGELQPNPLLCNYAQDAAKGGPAVVDALPRGASPFGCLAMAGGVSEWCDSWYRPYSGFFQLYPAGLVSTGNVGQMRRNGLLVALQSGRIVRGGSWLTTRVNDLRSWRRTDLPNADDTLRNLEIGFRPAYLFRPTD